MASLHKDPRGRSPYWYCAYTLPSGKRVFKSTKQTDRQKAQDFCASLGRASRLALKGDLTEERARRFISEIVENALGEPLHSYTIAGWFREWVGGKNGAKAAATVVKYRRTTEAFVAFIGDKANRNLVHVTPRDIRAFRDSELQAGKHPNTCNWLLKHLRMALNAARRQGLLTHNPAEAVELLRAPAGEEKSVFEPEQLRQLLKAAEGDWRGAILLGFYTGARLQDVANLRWSSVDLERQLMSFRAGKTGKAIVIPLHPDLAEYFGTSCPAPGRNMFLFPSLAGKSTGGKSGLSMSFARLMGKAGISGNVVRKASGAGRSVHSLSFHSLRHSFNSALANAGISQEIRQKLTGHASPQMNKRYTHHEIEPLRSAVAALPSLHVL